MPAVSARGVKTDETTQNQTFGASYPPPGSGRSFSSMSAGNGVIIREAPYVASQDLITAKRREGNGLGVDARSSAHERLLQRLGLFPRR